MTNPVLPTPGCIHIRSLAQANRHKRRYQAVLTLEDPRTKPGNKLRFTTQPAPDHLVMAFEDFDHDDRGIRVATEEQVAKALAFGAAHREHSLLVHCFHGVGRSAAIGLAIHADRLGPGQEAQAVDWLIAERPEATPNLVVVALADQLLGRDGALIAAVAASEKQRNMAPKRAGRLDYFTNNPGEFARI